MSLSSGRAGQPLALRAVTTGTSGARRSPPLVTPAKCGRSRTYRHGRHGKGGHGWENTTEAVGGA
jgi:hypothetical protein